MPFSHLQIVSRREPLHHFRMELNIRIRELRKARGLTLEQLASRISVSAPHLSEVERGKKNLNNHLMERLASALGVSHAELIAEPEPDNGVSRLMGTLRSLPEADRARVEAFALALLQSQQESQQEA